MQVISTLAFSIQHVTVPGGYDRLRDVLQLPMITSLQQPYHMVELHVPGKWQEA